MTSTLNSISEQDGIVIFGSTEDIYIPLCELKQAFGIKENCYNRSFENLTIRIDETYTKFKGKNLMTTPKTKSSKRTIHIPQTLADELKEYMDSIYGLEQDDRIFFVTKSGLHREIDRGVDACSIPDICVHGLRHSFSSMAQSEEVKAAEIVVSTILGHSKKKTMTAKYSHAYEKDLIAVAERLNKLMEDIENV